MDVNEFARLFRNVDKRYFLKDDDLIYFKYAGSLYDITSPTFWNNYLWVKHLNLSEKAMRLYNENLIGLKENILSEWRLKYKYDSTPDDLSWLNQEAS